MLGLTFKTNELTAGEMLSVERCAEKSSVAEMINFIVARVERLEQGDTETMVRELLSRPVSETRRLFHQALVAAMPATREACARADAEVTDQAAPPPAAVDFPEFLHEQPPPLPPRG